MPRRLTTAIAATGLAMVAACSANSQAAQHPSGRVVPHLAMAAPTLAVPMLAGANSPAPRPAAGPLAAKPVAAAAAPRPAAGPAPPQLSLVARANRAQVAVYDGPGTNQPPRFGLNNPNNLGAPLVFLVKTAQPGWLQVYLPQRPNGSTGWVPADSVTTSTDPYSVVISMPSHTLTVYKSGAKVESDPVGVGRSVTPTPGGTYYLTELLATGDPSGPYGPWAFGVSAFSPVITSFNGGPGQIGLHGTDYPAGVGTDVSHGCLRVTNDTITRLAQMLPVGTPLLIQT